MLPELKGSPDDHLPHRHAINASGIPWSSKSLNLLPGYSKIVFNFFLGHVLKILFGHYCLLASPSSRRTLFVGGVKAWYISSTATYFR